MTEDMPRRVVLAGGLALLAAPWGRPKPRPTKKPTSTPSPTPTPSQTVRLGFGLSPFGVSAFGGV